MNQRKRAVWGFILCSLLCCGAGVSAKEAAAGEKAAMPLWTRAAVQYENPYFTGNPDASFLRKHFHPGGLYSMTIR